MFIAKQRKQAALQNTRETAPGGGRGLLGAQPQSSCGVGLQATARKAWGVASSKGFFPAVPLLPRIPPHTDASRTETHPQVQGSRLSPCRSFRNPAPGAALKPVTLKSTFPTQIFLLGDVSASLPKQHATDPIRHAKTHTTHLYFKSWYPRDMLISAHVPGCSQGFPRALTITCWLYYVSKSIISKAPAVTDVGFAVFKSIKILTSYPPLFILKISFYGFQENFRVI